MASQSGAGRLRRGRGGRRGGPGARGGHPSREPGRQPEQAHAHLPRWQSAVLPAMLGADRADRGEREGVRVRRSLRDWVVDVILFVGALGIGIGGAWSDRHHAQAPLLILDFVLIAPAAGALWVRRRLPFAVALLTAAAAAVSNGAGGAAIVAMFSAAIYCRPRRIGLLFALLLLSDAITPAVYPSGGTYATHDLVLGVLATIIATAFGAFVRARRELVLSLHERARTLQEEQALRISEARQAERTRIAREMHDVLAHRISLLAVHAGALEFHPDAPPEEIARAAAVIRESARAAQEELREVIGVLRTEPVVPPPSAAPAAGGPSLEPPQPTIDDLWPLAEESRATGMKVRLAIALEPPTLPPRLGRTVYRVVQEGLTNVRKHASGHVVTVTVVGGRHGGVRVSVVNHPAVGRAGEGGAPHHVGSGTGLIGLGERVALAGGTLESGPLPAGGFRLSATLPWQSDAS
jgi:signal transduction histidine kinase